MKCEKCGIDLSSEDLNEHNLVCSYSISDNDYKDLIPCEICGELISFEDYQRHIDFCSKVPTTSRMHHPNFNLQTFPILQFRIPGDLINPNNPLETEEHIIQSINQINNDPIARSIFSVFVGELNNLEPISTDLNQTDNTDELDGNDRESDHDNNDLDESNETNQPEFNFFQNLNNTSPVNGNLTYNAELLNIFNTDENYEELLNLEDHIVGISNIENVSELLFEEITCPICSENKIVSRKTICTHRFCDECLQEWLRESKKCPTCMVDLE